LQKVDIAELMIYMRRKFYKIHNKTLTKLNIS
jgi:hypothetical protein